MGSKPLRRLKSTGIDWGMSAKRHFKGHRPGFTAPINNESNKSPRGAKRQPEINCPGLQPGDYE